MKLTCEWVLRELSWFFLPPLSPKVLFTFGILLLNVKEILLIYVCHTQEIDFKGEVLVYGVQIWTATGLV